MNEPAKLITNTTTNGEFLSAPCLFCATLTRLSVRVHGITAHTAIPICVRCGCSIGADAEELINHAAVRPEGAS